MVGLEQKSTPLQTTIALNLRGLTHTQLCVVTLQPEPVESRAKSRQGGEGNLGLSTEGQR